MHDICLILGFGGKGSTEPFRKKEKGTGVGIKIFRIYFIS